MNEYNLLRLEMKSGLERSKNLENIEFHLPTIIVAEMKTSNIFLLSHFLTMKVGVRWPPLASPMQPLASPMQPLVFSLKR